MAIKHMDTALPPPEVKRIIRKFHLCQKDIDGWFAVPTINPQPVRLSFEEIIANRQVDAVKVMWPFRGNKILNRSIRKIDLGIGCGRRCHTCLADASFLSSLFSLASLKRLLHLKWFLNMLDPERIRLGNTGDPSDHPELIKITELLLYQTRFLDQRLRRRTKGKERHKLTIFTNYRPNGETQLTELLELAVKNRHRLSVTISLPLNRNDSVNERFVSYAKSKRQFFLKATKKLEIQSRHGCIRIQDIRRNMVFTTGRRLSKETISQKQRPVYLIESDRPIDYRDRGSVEMYLNPDALWFMVYSTIYESHTVRSYTPANPQNLSVLSLLPWTNHQQRPPKWPGGSQKEMYRDGDELLMAKAKLSGKKKRPVTYVK